MKNHIIISLLFLCVGFSQQEYNSNDLIEMDNGLWTVKFSDELITGLVYDYFGENNKKVYIGNLRNGKKEGNWTWWYDNGQMKFNNTFKEGKENGLFTSWYENGQKSYEGTFKDGEQQGLHTSWYENGEKIHEGILKDGKPDGLTTEWYENGQKLKEETYKDGELISKKEWNEDGSVKE